MILFTSKLRTLSIAVVIMNVVGCISAVERPVNETKPVGQTRMYLLNDRTTLDHFPDDEQVKIACCSDGRCESGREGFVGVLTSLLPVDSFVDKLFESIAKNIDKKLKEYENDYQVTGTITNFYSSKEPPVVANQCVRVVRGVLGDESMEDVTGVEQFSEIYTDNTFAVVFDKKRLGFKTWLVRGAFHYTPAKTIETEGKRKIAVTPEIKIVSRWINRNFESFKKEQSVTLDSVVFDKNIVSQGENGEHVQYFQPCVSSKLKTQDNHCVSPKTLSLVPISDVPWGGQNGYASITVNIVEVGNAPEIWKKLKAFFGRENELGKQAASELQDLINKGVEKLEGS